VKLQIGVAAGEALPFTQDAVVQCGHAIECRIYAEDPESNFSPSPGRIIARRAPAGPGIRLDDGIYAGWTVPNEYDPLLGKLIAWGADRKEAISRLKRALDEYYAMGIRTNVGLFRRILNSPDFQTADVHTRWLDDFLQQPVSAGALGGRGQSNADDAAAVALAMWHFSRSGCRDNQEAAAPGLVTSKWKVEARREQLSRAPRP